MTALRPILAACLFAFGTALMLTPAGCGPSATAGGFDSPNPAARMYAIEQAARTGDQTAVRSLIEQLSSDDPAVRMMAISTLERLTGQTYGYRHYDDPQERQQAIARWVAAYNSGEIGSRIQSMNGSPPASQPQHPTGAAATEHTHAAHG